jgi:uncharacterized protein (TIGR03085 family)
MCTAYHRAVTDYARRERRELADLLLDVGPDQPTVCEGWTTRDLAAHLIVRERRMGASLLGRGEQVRRAKAAEPYAQLVAEVRDRPRWSLLSNALTDELANGVEFFIHHEDVRRGGADWEPRTLDEGQTKALWRTVKFTARLGLRKAGIPVLLTAPGRGSLLLGGDPPQATVSGEPGELALFVSGRQRVARVELGGDAAERLRTARLGM